jgi:hypothetical protein
MAGKYILEDLMSLKGYSFVSNEGFLAYPKDLSSDPLWAAVAPDPRPQPEVIDPADQLARPTLSAFKSFILCAVAQLEAVIKGSATSATDADETYDRRQRQLGLDLESALLSDDPAHVSAAQALKEALIMGDGGQQVHLSYQREVDFGRQQVALAARADLAPLITLLSLAPRIAAIHDATERLALVIGRADQGPILASHKRIKLARTQCAATFNAVHLSLIALRNLSSTPTAHAHIDALLAPFIALLARHPRPTEPTTEPTPTPTP